MAKTYRSPGILSGMIIQGSPIIQTGEPPLLVAAACLKHSADEIKEVIRAFERRGGVSGSPNMALTWFNHPKVRMQWGYNGKIMGCSS